MMATGLKYHPDIAEEKSSLNFDIFSAFERLETSRKLSLCDQLFHGGALSYRETIHKLWPAASDMDASKLQHLLQNRINKYLK